MTEMKSEFIRNLAIVGHGDAGKTSFVSAAIFSSGGSNRLLRVDEGNTITDFDEDEIKRKISISTGVCSINWKKHKINLLDTPGYSDFIIDAFPALKSADLAAFVINSNAGIECNLERLWDAESELPKGRLFLINKLDRENTSFGKTLETLRKELSKKISPVGLPVGQEANFTGVVDLISQKVLKFDGSGSGKFTVENIPSNMSDEVEEARTLLIETVAESDEELLNKYCDEETITSDEIRNAMKKGILEGLIYPVFPISAIKNIGITYFLDFCVDYCPAPSDMPPREIDGVQIVCDASKPLVAQIFKTIVDPYTGKISVFRVYSGTFKSEMNVKNTTMDETEKISGIFTLQGKTQNQESSVMAGDIAAVVKLKESKTGDTLCGPDIKIVFPPIDYPKPLISYTFIPESKSDEEKISTSLTRLVEEDPTLKYERNAETNELIVSGMGQLHLEVTHNRLKRKYGVNAIMKTPKIPYKETIKGKADVRYRHKKQTGGAGQFGEVAIRVMPLPRGGGFEFANMIVGGVIPGQFIPSVEKGVRGIMNEGIVAGYNVTDIRVELYDGKSHPVDSKDIAFQIAGAMALKQAFKEAKPILLEPIMKVKVTIPETNMGDIIGDLNSKRGKVVGMDSQGRRQIINALVPMSEMLKFEPELRSMTGGRGAFTMEFDHYEELPSQLMDVVVSEFSKTE